MILGEAKVDPGQPDDLVERIRLRYSSGPPGPQPLPAVNKSKERDAWKLAVALWKIRPPFLRLVAPGVRRAYSCAFDPLAWS